MTAISGTNIAAMIAPFTTDDTYATHYDIFGKGGFRVVDDATARDAISTQRRVAGMWVVTADDNKVFRLEDDLTSWTEVTFSGGGGSLTDGDYGDIVVSGSGTVLSIDSSVLSTFARTILDDTSAAAVRTTLGVAIGSNVQAWDALLDVLSTLVMGADKLPYFTSTTAAAMTTLTSFGRSLIDDADQTEAQTTLGLLPGTDVQGWSVALEALSALTPANGFFPFFSGPTTAALGTLTTFTLTLLDDVNAATARSTLGLAIGTDVQGYDADLATIAAFAKTKGNLILADGTNWTLLGIGATDQVLTVAGGTAAWADLPAGLSLGATLSAIDAETYAADDFIYFTGTNTPAKGTISSYGRSLVDDANASAARTTLGIVIGTDVQAHSSNLDSWAALAPSAKQDVETHLTALISAGFGTDGQILSMSGTSAFTWIDPPTGGGSGITDGDYDDIVVSSSGTVWSIDSSVVSTFARTFLDDTTASAVRTTLGLVIGTDVQAFDAQLASLASVGYGTDGQLLAMSGASSFAWVDAPAGSSFDPADYYDKTASDARFQPLDSDLTTWAGITPSANAQTLLTHTFSQMRTDLGLVIGTNVQAWDADLDAIAALVKTKGNIMVADGTNWTAVGVGADDDVLYADSAQTAGVRWDALPTGVSLGTVLNAINAETYAADDFIYFNGANSATKGTITSFGRSLVDDVNAAGARSTLGLVIGTDVQAHSANLDSWSALATSAKQDADSDLTAIAALTTTTFGRSLLTQADAAALRTTAGVVIGTNVQAWDADLDSIAGLTDQVEGSILYWTGSAWDALGGGLDTQLLQWHSTADHNLRWVDVAGGSGILPAALNLIGETNPAADTFPYFVDAVTADLATLTPFARTLLDDAAATNMRTTLGLVIGTDVMPWDGVNARFFDTKSDVQSATIPSGVHQIRTGGYASVGDGGGALYKKVGSAPSHAGKIQSADGAWWELANWIVTPVMFGAVGDGSTDDSTALNTNLFGYVTAKASGLVSIPVDGLGKTYATSVPLTPPSFIHIYDAGFKALSGASWAGGNGTQFSYGNKGVLTLNGGFQRLSRLTIDCNRITSCQGIYASGPNYQNVWDTILVTRWKTNGNGIVLANYSLTEAANVDCLQWIDGDTEYLSHTDRKGVGMILIGQADSIFISCNWANAADQLYVDGGSHHNRFQDCHPYCVSAPGTATANPGGVTVDGSDNVFDGLYLDVCPMKVRTTASTGTGRPSITITNTNALYDSANSTFSTWITFETALSNTPIYDIKMSNNHLPTAAPVAFTTTGSGTWAATSRRLAALNAAVGDAEIHEPGGATTRFWGNIDLLGVGYLAGYTTNSITDTSSARTLSVDDSGKLVLMTLNNNITITAAKAITTGLDCYIYCPNHSATIIAETGATINGLTTGITLAQNVLYKLVCYFGTGANAQYGLMGLSSGGSTLTDGDYGDIVVSSSGAAINFDSSVVTTFAKTFLDDTTASAVRTTLGLAIGTDVQAYDADLAALAGLTSAANKGIQFTGSGTAGTYDLTTFAKTILDDADATTARATLGVTIGTNVQAWDADLDAIAALTKTKGNIVVADGSTWNSLGVGADTYVLTADSTAANGIKWAASTGGGGGGAATYRNRTINPFGRWKQAGLASSGDAAYTGFDQWYALVQTAAITPSQLTDVENGMPYMMRFTQAQATAQRFGVAQVFESLDCKDLRGKSVALKARVRCSAATTVRFAIVEWTGTADSPTKDIVNSWTNTTFTTGNFFTSTSTTLAATDSLSLSANTPTDISLTGTISGSANNIIIFIWTDSAQAQNVTLDIGGVYFGEGSSAPTFVEIPNPADDFMRCQRFFEKSYNPDEAPGTASQVSTAVILGAYISGGLTSGTRSVGMSVHFAVPKLKTPTCTAYEPGAGTAGKAADNGAAGAQINCSSASVGLKGCEFIATTTSNSGQTNIVFSWAADGRI